MMEYLNRLLLKGNEAVVYGALLAGCDAFYGYPITPASEVAHSSAALFPKLNRTFLQAESEISAINMVIGASAAGKRVMTGSSGLGISLKQEAVSYLAAFELPAVIVDIMRGGPGLGNISPEQSDYFQVVKGGGHGAYRCLVFTPESVQEMCDAGYNAFSLCEKYRMPGYILADGVIGQMMESVTLPEPTTYVYDPEWKITNRTNGEANYLTTIYLENDDLERRNNLLQEKYRRVQENEQSAEEFFTEDAELVLVAYGISARIARTAVRRLREQGYKIGMLRPKMVFPFPERALKKIVTGGIAKAFLCIELSPGQMMEDVKLAIDCKLPVHLAYRLGGNIPSVAEISEKAVAIINAKGGC